MAPHAPRSQVGGTFSRVGTRTTSKVKHSGGSNLQRKLVPQNTMKKLSHMTIDFHQTKQQDSIGFSSQRKSNHQNIENIEKSIDLSYPEPKQKIPYFLTPFGTQTACTCIYIYKNKTLINRTLLVRNFRVTECHGKEEVSVQHCVAAQSSGFELWLCQQIMYPKAPLDQTDFESWYGPSVQTALLGAGATKILHCTWYCYYDKHLAKLFKHWTISKY